MKDELGHLTVQQALPVYIAAGWLLVRLCCGEQKRALEKGKVVRTWNSEQGNRMVSLQSGQVGEHGEANELMFFSLPRLLFF